MDTSYKHNLCRFCLGSSGCLIDLFKQNREHGFILEEAIEELLRYKISTSDGYPPFICLTCFAKLSNFRLFKCQCHQSLVAFENIYMRKGNSTVPNKHDNMPVDYGNIKSEPQDIVGDDEVHCEEDYEALKCDSEEGVGDDFVPCEVSIKTEQDEVDLSCQPPNYNEVQREISDDNYSEMDDGDDVVQLHFGNSGESEYYNDGMPLDHTDSRSEVPQKRKSWDKVSMIQAVEAVMSKQMSLLKAAKAFNVPRSTIKDYVKRNGKNSVDAAIGRKRVLPTEVENELISYCLHVEEHFFGLLPKDVERMAYAVATRNGLNNPFWKVKQGAGRKWIKQFFQRHKNLKYRRPQTLIAARMSGFTRDNVSKFFTYLEPRLVKVNFSPDRVFNVDETSITIAQEKMTKILCLKGKGQIECLSPVERETLITTVTCVSASGMYVPPMLIFPRTEVEEELFKGAPEGTFPVCDPTGWLSTETYLQWFAHFVSTVKPTQFNPVVLILDAHYSHNRNIDVIDAARANHVELVCLPPHSAHKMQPMDVGFMSKLKNSYSQEVEEWRKSNEDRQVTRYEVASLFGNAYRKTATMVVAAHGFWKTGIFPFQRNAFGDHDFASNSKDMESRFGFCAQGSSAAQTNELSVVVDPEQPSTSGKKVTEVNIPPSFA